MAKSAINKVRAKLDLAQKRIGELDTAMREFIATNESYIVREPNHDHSEEIWCWRLRNDDLSHISALAGEIGHLLRTPLDNIMCEIAFAHSGRRDHTYFPFSKLGAIGLEDEIKAKCKYVPDAAKDFVRSLSPYRGGDDLLWALHDMNRADKHPGVHAVVVASGTHYYEMKGFSGRLLVTGSLLGQHLISAGHVPKRLPFERAYPGEFMTTTPGAVVELRAQPAWQIAFTSVEGFDRQSIVKALKAMHSRVQRIVDDAAANFINY